MLPQRFNANKNAFNAQRTPQATHFHINDDVVVHARHTNTVVCITLDGREQVILTTAVEEVLVRVAISSEVEILEKSTRYKFQYERVRNILATVYPA